MTVDFATPRAAPHNPDAEAGLLGALLYNNRVYDKVCEILRPEFFSIEAYGQIYAAIAQGINAGRVVDAVTLKSHFGDMQCDNGDGSFTPMWELAGQCLVAMPGVPVAPVYARTIADAWHRRQLIEIGYTTYNEANGPALGARQDGSEVTARDVHEAAEARLYAVAAQLTDAGQTFMAGEAGSLALAGAEEGAKRRGAMVGVTTGFSELDDLTGGWRKGQLIIMGARPSMGKTAAALSMATAAAGVGIPVLFESAEMPAVQIGARMLAGLAGLPGEYADRGMRRDRDHLGRFVYSDLAQADWDAMVKVQRHMADPKRFPLVIDECRQRTMASIRSRARQMQRKQGLGLIVIDYLGLLRVPELARTDNRVLEVSRISADAKALALELQVPVVLLSQLNRAVEGREDRRPRLSDLRDSGSLEQDADIVMFLHREHYYLKREPVKRRQNETEEKFHDREAAWSAALEANRGRGQLLVDKQRMGPVGTVDVAFNETNGWISDPAGQRRD